MKQKLLWVMLGGILLIAVLANALPVVLNQNRIASKIADNPPPEYALHYMPIPNWWPH